MLQGREACGGLGRSVFRPVLRGNHVSDFFAEKEMAKDLRRLRQRVKKLREEIRGGAIPVKNPRTGPSLPTQSERRSRPVRPEERHRKGRTDR
jgi:hypothetical protein